MRTTALRRIIPARARVIGRYQAAYDEPSGPALLTITLHEDQYAPRGPRRFLSLVRAATAAAPSEVMTFTYTGRRLHEAAADYAASLRTARDEAADVQVLA